MALSTFALNSCATHFASIATKVSLHSADPGATGANDTSAAHVTASWGSASGGAVALSGSEAFTGGASSGAVQYVGLWDASANWLGGFQIPTGGSNDLTFNAAGDYTLDSLVITFA
jgi:hypothetical protein